MEKIKESGLAKSLFPPTLHRRRLTHLLWVYRSIGVSNFEVSHLEQVFSVAKYKPVVNQV